MISRGGRGRPALTTKETGAVRLDHLGAAQRMRQVLSAREREAALEAVHAA